jgi:hypothetical protein
VQRDRDGRDREGAEEEAAQHPGEPSGRVLTRPRQPRCSYA